MPQISRDGQWLAFQSADSSSHEIFVQQLGRPGSRVQVSVKGGGQPRWSRDGHEIFFRSSSNGPDLWAAPIEPGSTLKVGAPRKVWSGLVSGVGAWPDDVAPDGRFLVMKKDPTTVAPPPQLRVIVNWLDAIRK